MSGKIVLVFRKSLISLVLAAFLLPVFAAGPKDSLSKKATISIVPTCFFNLGYRLDGEFKLKGRHWLLFAPQYFMGTRINDVFVNDVNGNVEYKIEGYGAELYHKIFLQKVDKPFGAYVAWGLKYHQINISFEDYTWQKFTDNGLEYYEYVYKKVEEKLDRYGLNIIFGYQKDIFQQKMLIDFYIGYGLHFNNVTMSDDTVDEVYRDYFWQYGYNGPHPVLGIRLGVVL
jgi:hypothetical protein